MSRAKYGWGFLALLIVSVPLYYGISHYFAPITPSVPPYTPLALMGRDVYMREGCDSCHTQRIRPFPHEEARYGHYSVAEENQYDHPPLPGTRRIGPDLSRVGKKYSNAWHRAHLTSPRTVVPHSIMPSYAWLNDKAVQAPYIQKRMRDMAALGVPYTEAYIANMASDVAGKTELDALIAYLQTLGSRVPLDPKKEYPIAEISPAEYLAKKETLEKVRAPWKARLAGKTAAEIASDPMLKHYAIVSSRVLFIEKCAACHGEAGKSNPNFPILWDDDWLYGGSLEAIETSIAEGRKGMMPAVSKQLTPAMIEALVEYVAELPSGKISEPGRTYFADPNIGGCVSCHGAEGQGDPQFGTPNLHTSPPRFATQPFETRRDSIRYTILHGVNDPNDKATRNAVMPIFKTKLSVEEIRALTVYVRELGGT